MPTFRNDPYLNFNFSVEIDGEESRFSEVVLPDLWLEVVEYRLGSDRSSVRKLPGLEKVGILRLKRGVVGAVDLFNWWKAARNGDAGAHRTVVVKLLNEARDVVWTWRLARALPIKYIGATLSARGNDVCIEELEVTAEALDIE